MPPEGKAGQIISGKELHLGGEGLFFFQVNPVKDTPFPPGQGILPGIGLPYRLCVGLSEKAVLIFHSQGF